MSLRQVWLMGAEIPADCGNPGGIFRNPHCRGRIDVPALGGMHFRVPPACTTEMVQYMALDIMRHGIVLRQDDGGTTIIRPGKNGGAGTVIVVPQDLADAHRLVTGDVVDGETKSAFDDIDEPDVEEVRDPDYQFDEPAALRREAIRQSRGAFSTPMEQLTSVTRINGLSPEAAADRPFSRSRRSTTERVPSDRRLPLSAGPNDMTGRMLDFAAPLGIGSAGMIYGPHAAGLTRTLRSVLKGIVTNAPDCVPIVLLLRARSEEITDWRRQFPHVDIVVGPAAFGEAAPRQTLRLCDLVLETAQRQTEIGLDVVLLVDSLTGLWSAMLEVEEADAQAQADRSESRQRLREWVQKAGCFHGEMPLGGGQGGSLAILGTVWHQKPDEEEEEERETHPHLRLLEHLLPETSWRVALSPDLAERRLYPAIDVKACLSRDEERIVPEPTMKAMWNARGELPRGNHLKAYSLLMDALETTEDETALLAKWAPAEPDPPVFDIDETDFRF